MASDKQGTVHPLRGEVDDEHAKAQAALDAERAAETEDFGDEEEQEQFPLGLLEPAGAKMPTRNLIPAGVPVSLVASIGKAQVPLRGGVLPRGKITKVLVQCRPGHLKESVLHGDDEHPGKVTEGKWEQGARAIYVELISPSVIYGLFEELLASEPAAAGALLDQMTAAMSAGVA
jgi:hypothetical protein